MSKIFETGNTLPEKNNSKKQEQIEEVETPATKTTFKTVAEMIKEDFAPPLPLEVIPNKMGINLCSVEAMSWQKQADGQLTFLTIHFIPATQDQIEAQGGLRDEK